MEFDQIKVEYNKDTFSKFFEPIFVNFPLLKEHLVYDFTRYQSGDIPNYFGKDSPYTQPYSIIDAELWHIHLKIPPNEFNASTPQKFRKCTFNDPDNDMALLYVRGVDSPNRFSLIAILHPDAHGLAKQEALISYLASVGRRFRETN